MSGTLEGRIAQLGRTIHNAPEAFIDVDLITVMVVIEFVERRAGELNSIQRVAIKAIMALAEHDAEQARVLASELR